MAGKAWISEVWAALSGKSREIYLPELALQAAIKSRAPTSAPSLPDS